MFVNLLTRWILLDSQPDFFLTQSNLQSRQQPIFYTGQVYIFRILDTLLTGGLIAGGSDGIHKLTQVFTVFTIFLEETQNRIKDKPN